MATLAAHRGHEIGEISRRVGAVAHLGEAGLRFDLVGFAAEQERDHRTLRHVLVLGDDPRGESLAALGRDTELLLLRHPSVRAAAVVPMPDPRLGERTCAYVVVDGAQLTLPEVHEHFAALEVAKFKWPEHLEHLTELPRTPVGKTDKKRLAAAIAEATDV